MANIYVDSVDVLYYNSDMYIRKTVRKGKNGKEYVNYLLVESVMTPKGPRQRTVCSLGTLEPAPPEQWYALAKKLEAALAGQVSLEDPDPQVKEIVTKGKKAGQEGGQGTRGSRRRSSRSEGGWGKGGRGQGGRAGARGQ
ncbi:MAG: hypothetical protein ACPL5F_14520 [Moorellaceae bacterium]